MAPGTTESLSSTTTLLPPLTTQFVQQRSCSDLWTTIRVNDTITVVQSNTADARFSSCQPPGWDGARRLDFSPGVCPTGWVWFSMKGIVEMTYTTASCCASGFSPQPPPAYVAYARTLDACMRVTTTVLDAAANSTAPGVAPRTIGLRDGAWGVAPPPETTTTSTPTRTVVEMHDPWYVTWQKHDTKTMTPDMPSLATTMLIPTWTPGQEVKKGMYLDPGMGEYYDPSLQGLMRITIGCSVTGGVLFIVLLVCVYRRCLTPREKRARALKTVQAGQQATATLSPGKDQVATRQEVNSR